MRTGKERNTFLVYFVLPGEIKRRDRHSSLFLGKLRNDVGILKEFPARSQFDCASAPQCAAPGSNVRAQTSGSR